MSPWKTVRRADSVRLVAATSLAVAMFTAQAAFGGDDPAVEIPASTTLKPTPRPPDDGADEFVPITRLVPRAKIVLKEKARLPDLDGEKTFAKSGKIVVGPEWIDRDPPVPMYPFAYNPIYFEDMNLERCGLYCGCCVQPVVSGLHFFGSVALLPYKMLISPPCSCVYPPGECPPCFRFSHCENFFGPAPDFGKLFGRGTSR